MSVDLEPLRAAASRLEQIAGELENPETPDSRSVELAREAAELAAQAGTAAAEAVRAAAADGDKG